MTEPINIESVIEQIRARLTAAAEWTANLHGTPDAETLIVIKSYDGPTWTGSGSTGTTVDIHIAAKLLRWVPMSEAEAAKR